MEDKEFVAETQEARIAVGSCSVRAQRLTELEQRLRGASLKELGEIAAREHIRPLSPIDDVRATAAYRSDCALTLVRRALEQCAAEC